MKKNGSPPPSDVTNLGELKPDWSLSPIPRYIQLSTLLRNRIASGKWQIGNRIPNVEDLARDLGVARETIRQALGLLEDEGLLTRERAKGTYVRKAPYIAVVHKLDISWSSLVIAHSDAEFELLATGQRQSIPGIGKEDGDLAPNYQMVQRRHSREGQPYLISTLHLDENIYKMIPSEKFEEQSTLQLLQDLPDVEIASARQVITIGAADAESSALLKIPINSPVGYLHRTVVNEAGTLIYVGEGIYRGDALRLEMSLR